MKLTKIDVRNFRLLQAASIRMDANQPTTILVGPNNSGKTSVAEALLLFVGNAEKDFSSFDFSLATRKDFETAQGEILAGTDEPVMPAMSIDLHFEYSDDPADLAVASDLLMDLDPAKKRVVLRVEFGVKDVVALARAFREKRKKEQTLFEFLSDDLRAYYTLTWFKVAPDGAEKEPLAEKKLVERMLRVDFVFAQRHIDDREDSRATRLSNLLHSHYQKHYKEAEPEKHEEIEAALKIHSEALGGKYMKAFDGLITSLKQFGYPQRRAPSMSIKAELNSDTLFKENTRIFYGALPEVAAVGAENGSAAKTKAKTKGKVEVPPKTPLPELPEKYNGLGFKNLIYMILQIQSFRLILERLPADRPRVHLIFIEEPETHLHPQVQSVFIRQIAAFLNKDGKGADVQVAITTHSSHVVADCGFRPIRYFRRKGNRVEVKDLLEFESKEGGEAAVRFLSKYMSLMRCDLFFADKAILVEGQVERLLLPKMISEAATRTRQEFSSEYISILEVGGAHAHKFKALLKFIEIPTLVITDLDSVGNNGKACPVATGTKTSNAMLKDWLPAKATLSDLQKANAAAKTDGVIQVAYQCSESAQLPCGRTFEEAFIYKNAEWLISNKAGLAATSAVFEHASAAALITEAAKIAVPKVNFALDLMFADGWKTPRYIADGLDWLAKSEAPQ